MTVFVTDELLTAYIDDELDAPTRGEVDRQILADPALADRLAHFGAADLPYRESFAAYLSEAPHDRLEAMLAAIPATSAADPSISTGWSRRKIVAAAIGGIVAGAVLDRGLLALQRTSGVADDSAHLRGEVAEYMALYTADTLTHTNADEQDRLEQLRFAGERLELDLSSVAFTSDGLAMRRAQVLQYDGKPLAQILYLDPNYGPLALCILAAPATTTPVNSEARHGMNLAYWSSSKHSYILASHEPGDRLLARADRICTTLEG